jgi:flagellin
MSLNSVNTNMGAMVALQSLESTNSSLAATQKQVSTGFRVADASDDGAAFAIAQGIRSTVGGLTSANAQLGNVNGLLTTTQSSLTSVSNVLSSFRNTLVQLSGNNVTAADAANYKATLSSDLASITNYMKSSSYNGKSLVGDAAGGTAAAADVSVAQDGSGNTYTIKSQGLSSLVSTLSALIGAVGTGTGTAANAALAIGGTSTTSLDALQTKVGKSLNMIGSNINYVSAQTTFNSTKIDALNSGLGSLVDADLAKESAQLTALQIRQQLGTQALSMANSAPQSLMSLFK